MLLPDLDLPGRWSQIPNRPAPRLPLPDMSSSMIEEDSTPTLSRFDPATPEEVEYLAEAYNLRVQMQIDLDS
jgi:hypothetical protein